MLLVLINIKAREKIKKEHDMKKSKKEITYILMAIGLAPLGLCFAMGVYNAVIYSDWGLSALLGDPLSLVCGGIGILLFGLGFVLWMLID